MLMTKWAREALAFRRQERKLLSQGYRRHETDWEIIRGLGQHDDVILDAVVSVDRKYVYTKIGKPNLT